MRPIRVNRAIHLAIGIHVAVVDTPPLASPGANSIHGFITVQITTIYLCFSYEGLGQTREERGRKEGRGERRSATLHSEVFHFNGPPGDWLTLLEDPSPFQHNGPLHYLFVLANVPPEATALVSTSFHFRVRLIAESTFLLAFLQIQRG